MYVGEILSQLFLFFEEKLDTALQNQKKQISEELKLYVLNILCNNIIDSFSSGERVYLFDLYQQSISGSKLEREVKLKRLGDYTIIHTGCFTPRVINSINGIDYYISMGRSAYETAGIVSEKEIYQKISDNFLNIVSLLNEAYEVTHSFDRRDLFKIHSAWKSTKSIPIGNFLIKNGILLQGN